MSYSMNSNINERRSFLIWRKNANYSNANWRAEVRIVRSFLSLCCESSIRADQSAYTALSERESFYEQQIQQYRTKIEHNEREMAKIRAEFENRGKSILSFDRDIQLPS